MVIVLGHNVDVGNNYHRSSTPLLLFHSKTVRLLEGQGGEAGKSNMDSWR